MTEPTTDPPVPPEPDDRLIDTLTEGAGPWRPINVEPSHRCIDPEQASPRPPRRPSPSYKPKTEADHDLGPAVTILREQVLAIPTAGQNPSWVKAQALALIDSFKEDNL